MTYKVQGWRQSNGELWKVNLLVNVDDGWLEIEKNIYWVIKEVSYSLSSQGIIVTLTLIDKKAYKMVLEPDAKKTIIDNAEIKKNSGWL